MTLIQPLIFGYGAFFVFADSADHNNGAIAKKPFSPGTEITEKNNKIFSALSLFLCGSVVRFVVFQFLNPFAFDDLSGENASIKALADDIRSKTSP